MALNAAPQRHAALRFKPAPDARARDALAAALAAQSPAPVHRWENDRLHLEYGFPHPGFDGIWRALCAVGIADCLHAWSRLRAALRALLEQNEREFLQRPAGWRQHVDRFYLVSAPEPGARATRRGGLWRKHEKGG
jgi:hypothetical protein